MLDRPIWGRRRRRTRRCRHAIALWSTVLFAFAIVTGACCMVVSRLCRKLDPPALERVAASTFVQRIRPGQKVFVQGTVGDSMFVVGEPAPARAACCGSSRNGAS